MIHTIDKDRRYGGRSQRINTPASMRKAEDYIKKENALDKETGDLIEKTNPDLWYSSTGIVDNFARQCMTLQKQQGYVFKPNDKRLMVHQIQSFDIRDLAKNGGALTPEKAHALGVEFVKRAYPNYQVLLVTHYNTRHIHNHILINGVANPTPKKDGTFHKPHKFQDGNNAHRYENEYTLAEVKLMDEQLCRAYGLTYSAQCYGKKQTKEMDLSHDSKTSKMPVLERYKEKIDRALQSCKHFDFKDFRRVLSKTFGISVKVDNTRNSITYKAEGEEKIKKVSGAKLGKGYRLEDINERLRNLKATADAAEAEFYGDSRSVGSPEEKSEGVGGEKSDSCRREDGNNPAVGREGAKLRRV